MKVGVLFGLGLALSICSASLLRQLVSRKKSTTAQLLEALKHDHAPLVSRHAKRLDPIAIAEIMEKDIEHAEEHPSAHFELLKAYSNIPNAVIALCLIFKHLQGDTLEAAKAWLSSVSAADKEKAFMQMSAYPPDGLHGTFPFVLPLLPWLHQTSLLRLTRKMLSVGKIRLASLLVGEATQTLCLNVPRMLKAASSAFNTDLFRTIAEHPRVTLDERVRAVRRITNTAHLAILHDTVEPGLIPSYLDPVLPHITAPHLAALMQRCPLASHVLQATMKRWAKMPSTAKRTAALRKLAVAKASLTKGTRPTIKTAQADMQTPLLHEQAVSLDGSKGLASEYAGPEDEGDTETPKTPPPIVMKTRRLQAQDPVVEDAPFSIQ